MLDLQETLSAVMEVGRYVPRIYGQSPEPLLTEAEATWISRRFSDAGVRDFAAPVTG